MLSNHIWSLQLVRIQWDPGFCAEFSIAYVIWGRPCWDWGSLLTISHREDVGWCFDIFWLNTVRGIISSRKES